MGLSRRDVDHVFQQLRSGVVPERGLEAFAVGIERQRAEIGRLLGLASDGEGAFKFLRGGYGCGKTFTARLAALDAQARGFATSFVVVSDNDTHFHRFDVVYRRVVQELSTPTCPRGALPDVVDRWIARIEKGLVESGADEAALDFDAKVSARMAEDIASRTSSKAPEDLARVLRQVFALKQQGRSGDAGALLSWLAGSENVAAGAKKSAGIKGEITSRDALDYLHGLVEIVKAADYRGLVIVIDEAETILRMRQDVRGKSLNGIRQICDGADRFKGLLWVFTGTEEFFDTKRGVAGLQPLHDRIRFLHEGNRYSLKQPQLKLEPFDKARLREVALKLREIYPSERNRSAIEARFGPSVIERLIDEVTAGFKGDVGVVPRQFLRRLVNLFDLVDENPDAEDIPYAPAELTPAEERATLGKRTLVDPEPGDDQGYRVEF